MSSQTFEIGTTPEGNKYYVIDGVMYDIHFPLHWAIDHEPYTGPIQCGNCKSYGKMNKVFVCYCANCFYVYKGKRGGQIFDVEENIDEEGLWDALPYLYGVQMDKIGFVTSNDCNSSNKCVDEKVIPYYRGNGFMSVEEAIKRLNELKSHVDSYENSVYYGSSRKLRIDYLDMLEEIIYLEQKIKMSVVW